MSDSSASGGGLHLLAYGDLDSGTSTWLRIGQYVKLLAALGVEVRSWSSFADDVLSGATAKPQSGSSIEGRPDADALRDAGLTAIAWADVILFRRVHSTHYVCTECGTFSDGPVQHREHLKASGHFSVATDPLLRPIVEMLSDHPSLLGGRAVVYETDDDLLNCPDWTGVGATMRRESDLIGRLLRLADLVTTTTPVLAERLAAVACGPVRVIRNAIDPAWYSAAVPDDPLTAPGDPRVVYHGVPVRLRDYEVAQASVDAIAVEHPAMRRVWLGAANERRVIDAMDEVRPWVDGPLRFAASLVAARPEIGLAPLVDEQFNRAKSELHWLEYSMAGAVTVATAFNGPGPYDVIRDGADGLLAHSAADWNRQLRALVASPSLRADLAGRARERVLAEYTVADRAIEWADAYQWAARHGGIGRAQSPAGAGVVRAP
jgi:hypothetical protein